MALPVGFTDISGVTGNSRAAYANMLKYYYGPMWDQWIHTQVALAKLIAKKKGDMGGKEMITAVTTGLPASAGISSAEDYNLPVPSTGTYLNPEHKPRDLYTRLRWSGQVERAARKGDKAAWAKPRQKDVEDARMRFDLNFERKLFLGPYDILAVCSGANSTVTQGIIGRNSRTSGVTTPRNWFVNGGLYLHANQGIGFCDADSLYGVGAGTIYSHKDAAGSTSGYISVVSVNDSDQTAPTITMSANPTTVAAQAAVGGVTYTPALGDLIIPYASRKGAVGITPAIDTNDAIRNLAGYYSINGLGNVCTGTTKYGYLYALSKTDNTKLAGLELHNSETQRQFSELYVSKALQRCRAEGSGRSPDALIMGDAMTLEVVKENRGDRRFKEVQTESGYGKLVHHAGDTQITYEENWLCPAGLIFGVHTSDWGWYEESAMGPVDEDLTRWVADRDSHEQNWHKSGEIICRTPHANFTLDDFVFDQFDVAV
jgi:hypothetical protein